MNLARPALAVCASIAILKVMIFFGGRMFAQEKVSVWEGVYSDDQAARGESVYASESCGLCHGNELGGNEFGPPLVGSEWLATWGGKTAAELFTLIKDTMPQGDPGYLSRQRTVDLMAYMFKVNRIPAGTSALEHAEPVLQSIVIQNSEEAK